MPLKNSDPDRWDADPLSREISSQIAGMPDRPKVVITLISTSDDDEKKIIKAMAAHEEAFLNVHSIKVFDIPHRLFYLGFDPDTPVTLSDFLATLSGIPFAEGAIYVDGKPALRIAKLKLE